MELPDYTKKTQIQRAIWFNKELEFWSFMFVDCVFVMESLNFHGYTCKC